MSRARASFAFRRRASRFVLDELFSDDDRSDDDEFASYPNGEPPASARAAAHAGVDHVRMSFSEGRFYGEDARGAAKEGAALGIRNAALERWAIEHGCGKEVSVEDVVALSGATTREEVERAVKIHRWLEAHGGINYGVFERKADLASGGATSAAEPAATTTVSRAEVDVTEEDVQKELIDVLKSADLTVDTEKAIRQRVEARLGLELKAFKHVIKETIEKFLIDPDAFGPRTQSDAVSLMDIPQPPAFVDARPTIVIGAGPAGLAAATMIRQQGGEVIVLEARDRVGGRVHTDVSSFSAPVDLGASIVTGVCEDPKRRTSMPWLGIRADPSGIIAKQLGLRLVELREGCPLYDTKTGEQVSKELDEKVERIRDLVMDEARAKVDSSGESEVTNVSLGEALKESTENYFLKLVQDDGNDSDDSETHANVRLEQAARMGKSERRLLDWHWANLEYGCSASLNDISLPHWNQDEQYGGFGGAHCMVGGGYSTIMDRLAEGLDIRMSTPVVEIKHDSNGVTVETKNGQSIVGASVIVTVPLGCLKAGDVKFNPPLGETKSSAIERLGFGNLNKVVLEFDEVFWDQSVDYFGAAIDSVENRGRSFMFWNLTPVSGKPMLISLIAGDAAKLAETEGSESIVKSVLDTLARICFPEDPSKLPPLKQSLVTRWQTDPYARGSYSYVATGSKGGADYDDLGKPEGRILFAGEHTCKEHPDTVGGAMLTGWRAARQALSIARGEDVFDEIFDLESMRAAIAKRNADADYEMDEYENPEDHMIDSDEMIRRRVQEDFLADEGKEESKVVYRILSAVENGEQVDVPVEFATIMLKFRTLAGRRAMINALMDSVSAADRRDWALKHEGLAMLNEWLLESKSQVKSAESILYAKRMLELLLVLPSDLAALRTSGIPKTLKNRFQTHENGELRLLARQCGHKWMQALSRKSAGLPPIDEVEDSKKKAQLPQRKKPSRLGAAVLLGLTTAEVVEDDADEIVEAVRDTKFEAEKTAEQIKAKRDAIINAAQDLPEGQAARAAREAAERAHAQVEEAMRLAEEAQRAAREAEVAASIGRRVQKKDIIASFDAFSDAASKKRERAKEKSKKRKAGDDDDDDDEDNKEEDDGMSLDEYHARIRKQVRHYVHEQLQDKRERGIVTKAECKKLEEKVVDKILENSGGVNNTDKAFMTSKRKEKIKSLVSAYCQSTVNARKKSKPE